MTYRLVARRLAAALERAGFPDARDEARQMVAAAHGDRDILRVWTARRLDGEPLPWITGYTTFLGHHVEVDRGVYVPRPQTELVARRAIRHLPPDGRAVDLATGSGAVAVALQRARPGAQVIATDIDGLACRCAQRNGVDVYQGNLGEPIPTALVGHLDVVVAVVPYVPSHEMAYLPRDTLRYEPAAALDGGETGLDLLEQVVKWGAVLLHDGGTMVLEMGGNQDIELTPALVAAGFTVADRLLDDDGDLRGIDARFTGPASRSRTDQSVSK
jgi:release factor glutamine methyltransferase